ncbi:NfeD family protein [Pseudomonas sp. C27(2019)]|uniref:NfeD family protein n=1 Tax=Pseudomonas sp. C27(2019) TaxID=2604941 RepID=UPI001247EE78|nr:NfeD family protein [Pseudomonas sp. C27(2019)]QEY60118.1 NfeD family protein [Pseudomonas sp. C27(2019)]
MSEYLQNLAIWDWLAFAALLLIVEMLGTAGYFLWFGMAAALVGLLLLAFPELTWVWQFLAFALLSLTVALVWWRRLRQQSTAASGLNQRGSELLGREYLLHEAISAGRGKIQAGDSYWLVSGPDLAKGQRVKVIGQQGTILQVELCRPDE